MLLDSKSNYVIRACLFFSTLCLCVSQYWLHSQVALLWFLKMTVGSSKLMKVLNLRISEKKRALQNSGESPDWPGQITVYSWSRHVAKWMKDSLTRPESPAAPRTQFGDKGSPTLATRSEEASSPKEGMTDRQKCICL